MMSYRFSNPTQKEVQLTTLRHLMVENMDDQIAKTALSNAIALSEATTVTGDLDEMMARTDRWYRTNTRWLSVFFVVLALAEFAFAYMQWREGYTWGGAGSIAFGLCVLFYCGALQGMWRIQRRYHMSLKMLENYQLELPTTPVSLHKVTN